ncbi:toll-like receptor 8 [Mercenaria mercenaria]|uniref:toll-like receptor 8 n=1 Tax=Mercenaria mercenaria TaxID=6596 RepID=UPI00234E3E86|nr:toll-like receptor 8 [Mercenaria mercenaria]
MGEMKNLKPQLYIVFALTIVTTLVGHGESEMFNEHCNEESNSTWTCNYIPKAVPEKYVHIRIVDFKRKDKSVILNSSSFADGSWSKVQTLEFNDTTGRDLTCIFSRECFKGLTSLKELRFHMYYFLLQRGVFIGLPSVHSLDMSKCYRLVLEDIAEQLKVPNTLPSLQKLYLSEVGAFLKGNEISLSVVEALSLRNITFLDISNIQISFVNATAVFKLLKSLEYLNVSYSTIADTWGKDITQEDMSHLKVFDISHTTLPSKLIRIFPGKYVIANSTANYSNLNLRDLDMVKSVFTPLVINASDIIPSASSAWIYNSTIIIDEELNWKVKQLIFRQNNLRYSDLLVKCPLFKFTSLAHLDLSDNKLQMLHPTTCMPKLESFDLSHNDLFRMLDNKPDLFEVLFSAYTKLRVINLSNNGLPMVPPKLFKNSKDIEIIDLSYNKLEQLHLDLMDLHHLRVLDVSNNMIKILDEVSIKDLNEIPCAKLLTSGENQCSVVFTSNPITCSTCDSKPFIEWLSNTRNVNTKAQSLSCTNEDGLTVNIDESVTRKVKNICYRRKIIIVSSVSTGVTLLTITMVVSFVYRRKQKIHKKRKRENIVNKLIEGEGQFEFVVFLSYSSRDDQFVQENVIDHLSESLQLMTGIDRNLVCTGDQHLRPGFMVHDETIKCLDRASVIIIVVSNNYCRSAYCQNEFDQAYIQRKPIVLMLIEHVEEELMMPTLRQLYKRDVRILWTVENGQYVLKTTWENVCRSVLEKVQV